MSTIEVKNLVKSFIQTKKQAGIIGSFRSIISPEKRKVCAIDDISLTIEPGEIVGYLGPNGAGKSTTIKILTGILHPTSGTVLINGISPHENRKKIVGKLGVVFGQRTQLYWDLRLGESFELLRRIYRIKSSTYEGNLKNLTNILNIVDLMDIPVRQLSLGQRMKGDLVAAMLHSPSILFLDEPTIGLDIEAKYAIREFILELNARHGTTVILTTHDLDDVAQLCRRLIIVNRGKIIEDGPIAPIIARMVPNHILIVDLETINTEKNLKQPNAEIIKHEGTRIWYRFSKKKVSASQLISAIAQKVKIRDLSIREPDIEDVIREIYRDAREKSRLPHGV